MSSHTDTTAPVAPGHRRLLGGDIVTEADGTQVIPPPRARMQPDRDPAAQEMPVEASPASCGCPRDELELLRAKLAVEREARIRAEAHGAGLAEGYSRALAQVLDARPPTALRVPPYVPVSPVDTGGYVHAPSPISQREETPTVPRGTEANKGGTGGTAAATTAKPKTLSMSPSAVKKRRLRKNQAERKTTAAETAREVSPQQHVPLSPASMSPQVVPPVDTPMPAPTANPPAIRKASWREPVTPSPDKLFLGWYEEERRRFHPTAWDPLPAKLMPRWADWFPRALGHPLIGGDVEKLRETCRRWFADPWGNSLRTKCPASAFIADHIWPQHIPGQHEGSAPARETPAESRRRAELRVGAGEEGRVEDLPNTPAGQALARILAAMSEGGLRYVAGQLPGHVHPVRIDDGGLHLEYRDRLARGWLAELGADASLKEYARTLGVRVYLTDPFDQPLASAPTALQ
ncbi:hypothetical protein [Comamonas sp. JC664]|uniref:hypothetical protein n=1 Tax=Comamonas sp. JC664 TaxID=2801917 RepID=UPI00174A52E6|nr:hypothetical protein [Comamonas sp. JC664]MBL0698926.1 hypothetical protein [Comamonas sp. JC664]GHG79586.1 hypothetical protein GCM10012319_31600 [Comamonas sp. KCTC 72670]